MHVIKCCKLQSVVHPSYGGETAYCACMQRQQRCPLLLLPLHVYNVADSVPSRLPQSLSFWQSSMETVKVNNSVMNRLPWAEVTMGNSVTVATIRAIIESGMHNISVTDTLLMHKERQLNVCHCSDNGISADNYFR